MLYLICAPEAESASFFSPLSSNGIAQSLVLKQWMNANKIYMIYVAPSYRCLEGVSPFVFERRKTGQYVRAEIRYELCDRVILPEQKPHALPVDFVRSFGMQPLNVLGAMAGPEPTDNEFHRRVVEWFTNDFLEKYRDAPNPTAIIADGTVLDPIIKYLNRRQKNFAIPLLNPGQGAEYKSDGLNLSFSNLLVLS